MIEAYAQGYSARRRAQSTSTCEHPTGSTHQREWLRGWTEAQTEERAPADESAEEPD